MVFLMEYGLSAMDLKCTDVVVHHIDTGDARSVRQPLRRYPTSHVKVISRQVNDMMDQTVIEPACSSWASNLMLVKKVKARFDAV